MSAAVRGANLDRGVLLIAGVVTLAGVLLTALASTWFLLIPAFVGLNLLQASLTGWCPAALILKRAGISPGCAFR